MHGASVKSMHLYDWDLSSGGHESLYIVVPIQNSGIKSFHRINGNLDLLVVLGEK